MKVKDVMSENVTCCAPDARPEVARAMIECDCGEIPVVDDKELKASECMTSPCVTTTPQASVDECMELMQRHRIRRAPVVDENGGGLGSGAAARAHHAGTCCGLDGAL